MRCKSSAPATPVTCRRDLVGWGLSQAKLAKLRRELLDPSAVGGGGGGAGSGEAFRTAQFEPCAAQS
jgi:hypothetical protein